VVKKSSEGRVGSGKEWEEGGVKKRKGEKNKKIKK